MICPAPLARRETLIADHLFPRAQVQAPSGPDIDAGRFVAWARAAPVVLRVDRPHPARYVQPLNRTLSWAAPISPLVPDRSQLELMRLLDARQKVSQREVANSLGMSLGKANYCLRALIAKGFVKAENYRKSNNKLAYLYLLTPSGITAKAELTRDFLSYKMREYDELRLEIERLRRESEGAETG